MRMTRIVFELSLTMAKKHSRLVISAETGLMPIETLNAIHAEPAFYWKRERVIELPAQRHTGFEMLVSQQGTLPALEVAELIRLTVEVTSELL